MYTVLFLKKVSVNAHKIECKMR